MTDDLVKMVEAYLCAGDLSCGSVPVMRRDLEKIITALSSQATRDEVLEEAATLRQLRKELTEAQEKQREKRLSAIRAALEAAAQHVRAKYNRGDTCHPIQLQHEILLLSPDDILKRL